MDDPYEQIITNYNFLTDTYYLICGEKSLWRILYITDDSHQWHSISHQSVSCGRLSGRETFGHQQWACSKNLAVCTCLDPFTSDENIYKEVGLMATTWLYTNIYPSPFCLSENMHLHRDRTITRWVVKKGRIKVHKYTYLILHTPNFRARIHQQS